MKIVVIGGSGHIGSFLVPRLVRGGHEVVNVSRGARRPYVDTPEWQQVHQVTADRAQEDREATFGDRIADLGADVVVDLVCFTLDSATALVDRLRGEVGHLLHCGSIWRYGASRKLPISEGSDSTAEPLDEYGIQKRDIARMLKDETASGGLVTTSLHPGHIVGPGWHPVGPLGNFDPSVWEKVSAGTTVPMPGSGTELMHHVHADDLAQAFEKAIQGRDAAAGEDFNVVAPTALSVRGYAEIAASWFGQEPHFESVGWDNFRQTTTPEHADTSWAHLSRNHCVSIEKAKSLLGFVPRYEPERAIHESLEWLVQHHELQLSGSLGSFRQPPIN
ncbi:nucleoside-diphosphate-sugar epimerase [Paenarthrobacter nitroguajacolicus]|uniref:NAD-dependent epimerase/dehydratase family protein n=1 Tax=Paenarthrobacter nitroguajacolicus TaxID=211146 RepID=UPI00285E4FBE|nr:NAD(P)-dependent oxidoreductase [Paenarthrobacter nitroguajacolicus]MDR6988454.1 nucleoside-diphosphate-sugar epimerase [Paenarthrobacter nitroguajacolicus]